MIVISAVQSSTHTGIHNAILFIETSTMLAAKKFIPQWVQQQWRIQDFPDGGQLPKCYYFANLLPKTAWKWKNWDLEGGGAFLAPPWIRQWTRLTIIASNDYYLFCMRFLMSVRIFPSDTVLHLAYNASSTVHQKQLQQHVVSTCQAQSRNTSCSLRP